MTTVCIFIILWSLQITDSSSSAQDESIRTIIESISKRQAAYFEQSANELDRPFVLLTYAQSIDGKIGLNENVAGQSMPSRNFLLSGPVSRKMTHALRSIHEGILIGGTTFETDNPQLTNRLWDDTRQGQPRPVILDTYLTRLPFMKERKPMAQSPILCCSHEAAARCTDSNAEILPCRCNADGELDLSDVLYRLRSVYGIKTLMVEGGSAVLSSFWKTRVFDALCLTIAPKLVGSKGFGPTRKGDPIDLAASLETFVLGSDIVIITELDNRR